VHELKALIGSKARLLGKGEPPLLHQHADVIELLHVANARQASYHPLGTEPLQGLEVKVPKVLVLLPHLVIPMSSKVEGLCYLHVEDIESISASGYLGKKATMVIPNPHDSILDLHTRTALIQLSQADDRVPQCGDVVDSDEQSVLTRLGGEDDGADALDLHTGGIPKHDGGSDIKVKLSEELRSTSHVMGSTGVEARPVSLLVAEPSLRRVCALGSSRWRRADAADAAGDNLMLVCARRRAGSSSSSATWA
jgi:hypothetical protein